VESWDEIILGEGLRDAKGVVDNGTELDNALASNPYHRSFIATPKVHAINAHLKMLDALLPRLEKLFRQLVANVEALESVVVSTAASRGPLFLQTVVWLSWTPEHFLNVILPLPTRYHQSLVTICEGIEKLKDPEMTWEEGKDVVQAWAGQRDLHPEGVELQWNEVEDVFKVEVRGWGDG